MSRIVGELTQLIVEATNVDIEAWTSRMFFHVKPETVRFSVRDCIVCENVIWVSNPETGWRLICVQQTH
jgi:hypothetical protein